MLPQLKYYVAYAPKEQKFLPSAGVKARTHAELTDGKSPSVRLFATKGAAKAAVRFWKDGQIFYEVMRSGNSLGEDDCVEMRVRHVPERDAVRFVIKEVELVFERL